MKGDNCGSEIVWLKKGPGGNVRKKKSYIHLFSNLSLCDSREKDSFTIMSIKASGKTGLSSLLCPRKLKVKGFKSF